MSSRLTELALLPLAPWMLVQGARVRRTALLLPEPEGPRDGESGNGPPLSLLIVGDSAAAGVGVDSQREAITGRLVSALAKDFRLRWRLVARTGATTRSTLDRLARPEGERRDVVVSNLGVNDLTSGRTLPGWIRDQRRLVESYRDSLGARRIVLCGLPPVHGFPLLPWPLRAFLGARARRFDRALRRLARREHHCEHLPIGFGLPPEAMARDGFHPGARIYAAWADALADRIRAFASGQGVPG